MSGAIPSAAQLAAAHALIAHLNAHEWEPLAALLHPDFAHKYRPQSINPPDGKETRGKDAFVGVLKYNLEDLFGPVVYTVLEETHGVDRVVFHMKSIGKSKTGKDYNNEYMITFKFAPGTEQIIWLDEFVDSKYSSAFFLELWAEIKAAKEAT
ncbi:hypothetical protein HMN09_00834000 [Mycena chlorophos]|uniref:SnoaL-like domain-containing protein n=1 Tax=Mycena chlorophos TaxID=658473 RepID=A0A8H6W474_MYCCL|nr:hypothetical protein HMN09_00834000 [Mycena chlorophos]